MNTVSLQEALRLAVRHHQAGQLAQAEALYRQILQAQPEHADALHLLGVLAHQVGQQEVAVELIGKAIGIFPRSPEYHTNLGEALRAQGQLDQAIASYRRAIQVEPRFATAWNNLGIVLQQQGKNGEAISAYRRAITLKPDFFQALNNLAIALKGSCQTAEAVALYRQALALRDDSPETHNNLGVALREQGEVAEAVAHFQRALALRPDFADAREGLGSCRREQGMLEEAVAAYQDALRINPHLANAWNNLGVTLKALGRPAEAIAALQNALAVAPQLADTYNNLGITLKEQGRLEEATRYLQEAIALKPGYAEACNNLGLVYEIQGLGEEAVAAYRKTLVIDPTLSRTHSNVLFALNYLPRIGVQEIFDEHLRWAETYANPLMPPARPLLHDEGNNSRLRIGYVSPDFRQHPVSSFFEGVLEQHDASHFETFCYSDVTAPDATTARLRALAHHWRDCSGLSDAVLAEQIRHDSIDILVDLAGHTDRNRLLAFARRPAPLQASWIGYFNTTGMAAMDYFISDVYSSPPDLPQCFIEQLVRLPHTRFCYRPPDYAPPMAELPAQRNGTITFGCFNNLAKLNHEVVALWAEILAAVPDSRLLLKALALNDAGVGERYREQFSRHGIAPERIELAGYSPHAAMLAQYGEVDIALDPFPFTGGMTTCEALWMGVPVVTLSGETLVSRQSASMLANLGKTTWIAASPQRYREIAVALAADPAALAAERRDLRAAMRASPLCDSVAMARHLEAAYKEMVATRRRES
ncbi:MAG: tetratricopeptide repeat protein [Sulfuricella sp.]|nr:tetratricopeptide repeat protein [Sulfuricella sp.]